MPATSSKLNPSPSAAGAAADTRAVRSLMPTPVAWETTNRRSMAAIVASPSMPKALNAAVAAFTSTSVLRMRPASRNCLDSVSSVGPVRPSLVFRSATVVPIAANSAGTWRPTFLATSTRPSSASPVAPVPVRIVSSTSSNTAPRLYSALPAASAPAPTATVPAASARPRRLPSFAPSVSTWGPMLRMNAGPNPEPSGRTGRKIASERSATQATSPPDEVSPGRLPSCAGARSTAAGRRAFRCRGRSRRRAPVLRGSGRVRSPGAGEGAAAGLRPRPWCP